MTTKTLTLTTLLLIALAHSTAAQERPWVQRCGNTPPNGAPQVSLHMLL